MSATESNTLSRPAMSTSTPFWLPLLSLNIIQSLTPADDDDDDSLFWLAASILNQHRSLSLARVSRLCFDSELSLPLFRQSGYVTPP